jgi:alkylhydroperoxidase family enzyme
MAFISPPPKIPLFIRLPLWIIRKVIGVDFLIMRLLAWYPRSAISSAMLEALIAHHDGQLDERTLKLVRLTVSFSVGCPFCVDMNAAGWEKLITQDEIAVLQGRKAAGEVPSLGQRERLAIEYTRLVCSTPLHFPRPFMDELKIHFSEREIVILATTAAQVNYWTRLIQALGCPPAGFSDTQFYLEM